MIRLSIVVLCYFCASMESAGQNKSQPEKRYTKVTSGYLMVLRQNDNLFYELEKFVKAEKIPSANFTGMGFVNITFGFFDFNTKKYDPKNFLGVELASMHGTLAWKKDSVSIHAHGVVADKTFQAFGGHILDATVSTGSVEIFITVHDKVFKRKRDENIGADVLDINTPH